MSNPSFDPSFASAADFAAMYRAIGWQVVPAKTPKETQHWKRPALSEWRELKNMLVPDLIFQGWYGPNGDHANRANMGIITGRCSNLVVVDLDTHKNPHAQLWWLTMLEMQQTAGELTTVCQKTGGGGFQHFFRIPDGWTAPTCKTSIGVDIRGQGGFVMCPPSLHESGERYEWIACQEPWSVEIAVMPQWLCEEIDTLAAQYGAGFSTTSPKVKKTPPPNHSTTPYGQVIDGREDLMTRFIWGWIVNLRREAPMINDAFMATQCGEAFTAFERKVKSRLPHDGTKTNAELLEQEGRGITMFRQKWQYAAKQWEDKVADHARQGPTRREAKRPLELGGIPFDPETREILGEVLGPANKDEFAAAPAAENKFKLIPSDEMIDEPVKWLVRDLISANSLASLYGKPGTYKSFVALYVASHIALGWRVFDKETEQGDVVYIAGEGGAGLKRRHEALRKRHNMPPVKRLFFLKAQLNLRSKIDDVAGLIKEIKTNQIQPKLIVIDTLARAFAGGNENASEDMGAFIAMVGLLQQATGASVLLVHHSGKDQARGQRGHSSLLGAVDSELELMKLSQDDSIHRIGQLTTTKQKDGEDGLKFLFHMETVSLSAIDPENASLALVPIDISELPPKSHSAKQTRMKEAERIGLEALEKVFAMGTKLITSKYIPKDAKIMCIGLWRQSFNEMAGYKNPNSARVIFNRVKNKLKDMNIVSVWEKYCWFTEDYLSTKQM